MNSIDDFSVSLLMRPHRAWSTLFAVLAETDAIVWCSQSSQHRESPSDPEFLDESSPHSRHPLSADQIAVIRSFLRTLLLPCLPSGGLGLGGTTFTLLARDGFTSLRWTWWSQLPPEWLPLEPLVRFLQSPEPAPLEQMAGLAKTK